MFTVLHIITKVPLLVNLKFQLSLGNKYVLIPKIHTMNLPKYNDFDSREKFVQSLGHWHYDKWAKNYNEYKKISQVDPAQYQQELAELKRQLDAVRKEWNNQSQIRIRQEVAKSKNSENNLAILAGQENDRLQAGYDPEKSMYHVRQAEPGSVWEHIGQQFGLSDSLTRLHVQFPGDVTAWHTDIFAPYHNLLPSASKNNDDQVGQDLGIRRIIVALEDWNWGQCFMFGAQTWNQWQAGDVVYWNFGVPHCAANMGFEPRICMSVTGIPTQKFLDLIS